MKTSAIITILCLLFLATPGCKEKPQATGPKYGASQQSGTANMYRFAVHPLHNPAKLTQAYQPLIDYLNKRVKGAKFVLEASRDYASFEVKYQDRAPELILPNPWQTLQAMKTGYSVMATAGEPADFRGILIVRKDGAIRKPSDLKGKAVSYPSHTALAACVMPQYFLHTQGININKDIENRYVGSQESSIMNVFLQQTAAGATWPVPWRAFQKDRPDEAAQLKVVWETESLINNSVMIRNDIPDDVREQVRGLLTGLHESEDGKAILAAMAITRFLPASDKEYDVVRSYMERFEREVRKVATK